MAHPESTEVLVVYFGETLDALESLGAESLHERTKKRWDDWYAANEATVAALLDVYGNGFDGDAGPPGPREDGNPIESEVGAQLHVV